ncbi:MAG: hypothetical protein IJU66_04680, partial [Oscillospiraceae bacterium]|nr:hypothetical protein [Oscillospiraceae bacterium]
EETDQVEVPPAKLTYQEEDAEETAKDTAARTRRESAAEAESERASAARTAYPAAEETDQVEVPPAKLTYQEEDAEETAKDTAARTRRESASPRSAESDRAETAARAIPTREQNLIRPLELAAAENAAEAELPAGTRKIASERPAAQPKAAMRDIRVAKAASHEKKPTAADIRVTGSKRMAYHAERTAARPGALPATERESARPAAELFFSAAADQPGAAAYSGEQAARETAKKSAQNGLDRLPGWARELFENEEQAKAGLAALNAAKDPNAPPGATIRWSAPGANRQPEEKKSSGPAQIELKTPKSAEEKTQMPRQISDAELQRTADKVYRIIEERLRREMRRNGR